MKRSVEMHYAGGGRAGALLLCGLQQAQGPRPAQQGCEVIQGHHYEQAIDHFQQAVQLDPGLMNARMYLATAFVSQYIPGR